MANLDTVLDTLELQMRDKGETVSIAISGTYVMVIFFQVEIGSPGSGAWKTLFTFNTVDGVEAEVYVTKGFDEKVRLVVDTDTSGTAVATLTDDSVLVHDYVTTSDRVDNVLQTFHQQGVQFPGSIKSGLPIPGTATMTLTVLEHAGRTIVFPAAGGTVTLPAALGTGARFRFYVDILLTTSLVVKVANTTDVINGVLAVVTDIAGVVVNAAISDDTITLNKTTTGGLAGSFFEVEDVIAGTWMVTGTLVSSSTEATPFSATVN